MKTIDSRLLDSQESLLTVPVVELAAAELGKQRFSEKPQGLPRGIEGLIVTGQQREELYQMTHIALRGADLDRSSSRGVAESIELKRTRNGASWGRYRCAVSLQVSVFPLATIDIRTQGDGRVLT